MTILLSLAAALLLLVAPPFAPLVGIHPAIPAFVGIACGIVAVLRGAQPLPEMGGSPSRGADADALHLSKHVIDYTPGRGLGITDVGGAP